MVGVALSSRYITTDFMSSSSGNESDGPHESTGVVDTLVLSLSGLSNPGVRSPVVKEVNLTFSPELMTVLNFYLPIILGMVFQSGSYGVRSFSFIRAYLIRFFKIFGFPDKYTSYFMVLSSDLASNFQLSVGLNPNLVASF